MAGIEIYLDRLEDPFETFPLQSVAKLLASLADEQEKRRLDRVPWLGKPHLDVEDEHDIEVVEHLIGAAFVLSQAAIAQAVSLVRRTYAESGGAKWIPGTKDEIMKAAAPVHRESNLSKITILNAIADYYKHRHEWHDDWSGPVRAKSTIDVARSVGLEPNNYHNLERAVRELEASPNNMTPLCDLIVSWRRELAQQIRAEARRAGKAISLRAPRPVA